MVIDSKAEFKRLVDILYRERIVRYNTDIARALGIDKSNITQILNGPRNVSPNMVERLIDAYPILNDHKVDIQKPKAQPARLGVPVYDIEATAGDLTFNGDMPEVVQGHISLPNFRECIAFLYVRGDSMYATLKAGDLIGIIPVTDKELIQYGNIYLIVTKDNQRMIKVIRKAEDDDHIILRSKNKEYDDMLLPKNKVRKLFRVKGPVRDDWQ